MIRPLIINEELKARAAKIMAYAEKHHYRAFLDEAPGDNPAYVLNTMFGYRCVFSYTEHPNHPRDLYRDLSVSVSDPGKYPNEFALYTIASELFGFTGWDGATIMPPPRDWMIDKDLYYPAVRVMQLLPKQ